MKIEQTELAGFMYQNDLGYYKSPYSHFILSRILDIEKYAVIRCSVKESWDRFDDFIYAEAFDTLEEALNFVHNAVGKEMLEYADYDEFEIDAEAKR